MANFMYPYLIYVAFSQEELVAEKRKLTEYFESGPGVHRWLRPASTFKLWEEGVLDRSYAYIVSCHPLGDGPRLVRM